MGRNNFHCRLHLLRFQQNRNTQITRRTYCRRVTTLIAVCKTDVLVLRFVAWIAPQGRPVQRYAKRNECAVESKSLYQRHAAA